MRQGSSAWFSCAFHSEARELEVFLEDSGSEDCSGVMPHLRGRATSVSSSGRALLSTRSAFGRASSFGWSLSSSLAYFSIGLALVSEQHCSLDCHCFNFCFSLAFSKSLVIDSLNCGYWSA